MCMEMTRGPVVLSYSKRSRREEGIWKGGRLVLENRASPLRVYWSASHLVYGANVFGQLEVLLGKPGTLHSPGS